MQVMFDTNVLVKMVFVMKKLDIGTPIPKNLEKYAMLLKQLETNNFTNVMSEWNKAELRDVLMKLKLAEVFFKSGFTVDEFRDAKEEKIELSSEDLEGVNAIVNEVWKFCKKETLNIDVDKINLWNEQGYSYTDLILLHQAELAGCEYFVTNDQQLVQSHDLKKEFEVKICNVNTFRAQLT